MDKQIKITSPYDWQFAVTKPELFAGRKTELSQIEDEIARLAAEPPIATCIAIIGERKVGKSSLLYQTIPICRNYKILPAIIKIDDNMASDPWHYGMKYFVRYQMY